MVASWVSQASFEPLGLTVAVAKDRAIESLLQVRPSFAPLLPVLMPRFCLIQHDAALC